MLTREDLKILTDLRHALHRHPEASFHEAQTARLLKEFLGQHPPDEIIDQLGGHGVAAVYQNLRVGPTVMVRADMDALPITEQNRFAHRSRVKGMSHACGHDGHMSIVAGVAGMLAKKRPETGRVILLFQPAEENLKGADRVIADPRFERLRPDYAFALHNMPGYPLHTVLVKENTIFSAVQSVIIELFGRTAHASTPENGNSPLKAIETIVDYLRRKPNADRHSQEFSMATLVGLTVGEKPAYGVAPADGRLIVTLRAYTNTVLDRLTNNTITFAKQVAGQHHLEVRRIYIDEACKATINDRDCCQLVVKVARQNGFQLATLSQPLATGEDFGALISASRRGGAMFLLGAGMEQELHSPAYDFPDGTIATGVRMFWSLIDHILN